MNTAFVFSSIVFLLIGLGAGWLIGTLWLKGKLAASESLLGIHKTQSERAEAELQSLRAEVKSVETSRAETRVRLEEAQKNLESQYALLKEVEARMAGTFKALSHEALNTNSEQFLRHAADTMKAHLEQGRQELSGKKEMIDQSIEGIGRKMSDMHHRFEEISKHSIERIAEIGAELKKHAETTTTLAATTDNLRQTLASSKKRGEWGERMAEDIIRLIGMKEGVNYIKQKSLEHAAGRPDYTFLLPNKLKINMDVKFPMDNYQSFLDANTDIERKQRRDDLVRNVRVMIKQVCSREYIDTNSGTVDYVILFIPNEQVYGFINDSDPKLMDDALRLRVILCSPFTLYAVLAVVRQAVENFNLEQTASEILKHLGDFYKQWELYKDKFKNLGKKLEDARREYDLIESTRTNQLERVLRKVDDIRERKQIALDEQPGLDYNQQP